MGLNSHCITKENTMKKLTKHLKNDRQSEHLSGLEYRLNRTRDQLESFPLKGSIRLGTRTQ